jgi:hypothetical protein
VQRSFVSHGLEFRYDAALLGGLLLVAVALADPSRLHPALAGVAVAWIGLHHLKGALLALAVQAGAAGRPPMAAWRDGLASPRAPEFEALRRLRAAARPDEAVLDPSGLAYFLPPCSREWYTDTLYSERPGWMSEFAAGVPSGCVWVVPTYRLSVLPRPAQTELEESFELSGSGLALRRGDARLAGPIAGFPGWSQNYP